MSSRTFIAREESLPVFKASEDRLTLSLEANTAVDSKLKTMLIYHSENPRILKRIMLSLSCMIYKQNNKTCITAHSLPRWFAAYTYCSEKKISFKTLLLIDNVPGHPKALMEKYKINVVSMPANTTLILLVYRSRGSIKFQVLLFKKSIL